MKQNNIGFTLIELMVVVIIIGILAAVAIPSYQSYIIKSQQTDAVMSINSWIVKQGMYFSQNLQYAETFKDLGEGDVSYKISSNGFYNIKLEGNNETGLYIAAYPVKSSKQDTCGWYKYELFNEKRTNDPLAITPNRSINANTEAECWLLTK